MEESEFLEDFDLIELEIPKLLPIGSNDTFQLNLKPKTRDFMFSVMIRNSEATMISLAQNNVSTKRPFIHDIFLDYCDRNNCTFDKVVIYNYIDGIYFVHICFHDIMGVEKFDIRISDAIIIALKADVPIYIISSVLDEIKTRETELKTSNPLEEWDEDDDDYYEEYDDENDDDFLIASTNVSTDLSDFTQVPTMKLRKILQTMLDTERYEIAAEIDNELNRRNNNG